MLAKKYRPRKYRYVTRCTAGKRFRDGIPEGPREVCSMLWKTCSADRNLLQ